MFREILMEVRMRQKHVWKLRNKDRKSMDILNGWTKIGIDVKEVGVNVQRFQTNALGSVSDQNPIQEPGPVLILDKRTLTLLLNSRTRRLREE